MKHPVLLLLAATLSAFSARAQWSANPGQNLAIRDVAGTSEVTPRISPAPNGGTWVAWFETVATTNYQMRLQLLDANGRAQLGAAGLLVSNNPQSSALYRYDLKTDNLGNAILAFQDTRSGGNQCVAYKISPTGQQLWGANGIPLLDAAATSGLSPAIGITAGNNVVIGWNASGTASATRGTKAVPLVKYSPAGVAMWTAPVAIEAPSRRFSRPSIVSVPASEDVVVQYVEETGSGQGVSTTYAQRYNASGAPVWTAPVRVSDKTIGFAAFPEITPDGSGGFFALLNSGNPANANLGDMYAQRVLADGSLPWGATGTEILAGTATARIGGSLQYVAARNEVWAVVNELNSTQSNSGFTVQRLAAATGAVQLGTGGAPVQALGTSYYSAQSLRDTGTGLIIVYTENLNAAGTTQALWAAKVNYQGQSAFPTGSGFIMLSSVASGKQNYATLPYANNQLVTVWADQRVDSGIYAQSIGDNGALGVLAARGAVEARPLALSSNPGTAPALHLSLPHPQLLTVQVRDLTGRLVHQQAAPATGEAVVLLAAPELAAGVYFVETTVAGQPWRGRWVKP
ncbi:T9SS type A sorting domain-containing protein [Hymenobacter properus]|uniref:T9SS type A sorting domain-containing protein n=1 Tax=Hymenobacter properus TaxID=2791026 RepID=A0A931FNI5_9BACT|nr:T9SS type A sorting domain-containing protein [Hymenobacter properus]MBF9144181.1 T9SS type A sorting domain-containing protein [Hymenobacter properus]MBR7722998.1 T9SS type A sorting domain-containing protein [Microvirga sp. SRT04]